MAYFSMHAYDADVWVQEFRGLNQADVGLNPDVRYAAEEQNVETPHGILQPQAATRLLDGEFTSRVETLASFHRRWYEGSGSHDWYVCCAGGKLYQKQAHSDIPWAEIELPEGVTAYQNSSWSWVTYEINPENSTDTIDVLLMSNGDDGMIMIVPPDRPRTWGDLLEQTWSYALEMTWLELSSPAWVVRTVDTKGKKFGVIERYKERIWGGAIPGDPDMLMYSAPFDPTDWEANEEIPEDGAGDVIQPSWDGDKFCALKRFGDHLLAFKKNRVWKILGTNPGEYAFQEQFGGGANYFNTIAVDVERVFMCTDNGMSVYDGMSAAPYAREQVEQIWKGVNRSALDQMSAVLYNNRYYLAFPEGTSAVNNAMLVYNLTEGTILYYKDFYIETFMPTDDELYATSSRVPGRILMLKYDSWELGEASGAPCKWISPWMDFGYKRIAKGGFDLYFIPEVQEDEVQIIISMQTEKKLKTKNYLIRPLTETQIERHKEHRGKRLHFGGTGRKFRIIIETAEGVTAPWRLVGGLQLVVETDPD